MRIITRFAPSPTGELHIGSVRTAVFAWLFTKKFENSKFLLRIEDTDVERSKLKFVVNIKKSLHWLGIDWDDDVFFQSKRLDIYREKVILLLKEGKAYFCNCTKERLNKLREEQIRSGTTPMYDGYCKNLNIKGNIESSVVRFKSINKGLSSFKDLLRGKIEVEAEVLSDLVIWREDRPTYNFCVVIDDWLSGVNFVIRGDDHIGNTHKQIDIMKAFNVDIPQYIHLPMVLDEDGLKLSKRTNAKSILEYKNEGYLPQCMINYIVRLGASFGKFGNLEFMDLDKIIEEFLIKKISLSPSRFDSKKLNWLNSQHIKKMSADNLINAIEIGIVTNDWFLELKDKNLECLRNLINLFKDRVSTLVQLKDEIFSVLYPSTTLNNVHHWPNNIEKGKNILSSFYNYMLELELWDNYSVSSYIKEYIDQHSIEMKELSGWLRLVIVRKISSPSISMLIAALGKEITLERIKAFLLI